MPDEQRDQRLAEEHKRLERLQAQSTIFEFESQGDPPTKYVVTFRGPGITRSLTSSEEIEKVDLHRCELRLPYAFPQRPPDIRWLTPVHHPNISFSGLVKLRDVGLPWEEDLSLDIICERLWDMARLAYYDEDRATNYSARNWLEEQDEIGLPIDHRPLRDKEMPFSSNVIKYERRSERQRNDKPPGKRTARPAAASERTTLEAKHPERQPPAQQDGILFIGDESPPRAQPRRRDNDDDVVYIGYD